MFTKTKTMKYTANFSDKLKTWLDDVDTVIVGAGAGLSASGGLNYTDKALTAKWFPEYTKLGLLTIPEIQGVFWNVTPENALAYYAFWARHIWHIRYESAVLQPYADLKRILNDKDHFIITTNVDRQFSKAGFSDDVIYAMQGDYGLFQCAIPCTKELYSNKESIEQMIANRTDVYHIRESDIPRCPHCGSFLIPNLRKDGTFVEEPHLKNSDRYYQLLNTAEQKNILLLELGIGFNTPGIIRYPFERLAESNREHIRLIRINLDNATVPETLKDNALGIKGDIAAILQSLV